MERKAKIQELEAELATTKGRVDNMTSREAELRSTMEERIRMLEAEVRKLEDEKLSKNVAAIHQAAVSGNARLKVEHVSLIRQTRRGNQCGGG